MNNTQEIEIDESALIEKSRQDPKFFAGLYKAYFNQVYRFIYRRVNEKNISGDLTQQVFYNALTSLPRYQHQGKPFGAYLFRIAINECNQYFRDRSRTRFISIENTGVELIFEDLDNDFEVNIEKKRQTLQLVLGELDSEYITLIELRYFEQLSHKEIAQILNIKENHVKVKVHRLIQRIRKMMSHGK